MRSCEFWVIITDHKVEDCHFGMGVINGLHAAEIDQIKVELKEAFETEEDFDNFVSILKEVSSSFLYQKNIPEVKRALEWTIKDLISRYMAGGRLKFDFEPVILAQSFDSKSINIEFYKKEK